jgi:hypothetical protein
MHKCIVPSYGDPCDTNPFTAGDLGNPKSRIHGALRVHLFNSGLDMSFDLDLQS